MNNRLTERSPVACAWQADVAAYAQGELDPERLRRFEAHCAACAVCRADLDNIRDLTRRLQALPRLHAARDLSASVIAAIPAQEWGRRPVGRLRWWKIGIAAAAALLIAAGLPFALRTARRLNAPPDSLASAQAASQRAVKWLCRSQERDGSWSTARWGGHRQFEPALVGLALLAIIDGDPAPLDAASLAALQKGAAFLLSRQEPDGLFGLRFDSAPYNHGIATLAILAVLPFHDTPALRAAASQALALLREQQHGDGGWGYWNASDTAANLSITLWQIQALQAASELGGEAERRSLERGLRWLTSLTDEQGYFGYRQPRDFPAGPATLTAMGAAGIFSARAVLMSEPQRKAIQARLMRLAAQGGSADFYQRYFLSAALSRMSGEHPQRLLSALRAETMQTQVRKGPLAGSWDLADRWSGTGGRLYTTSMAALSLHRGM
jgi:hypothetical protein